MELVNDQCDNTVAITENSKKILQEECSKNTIPLMSLGACSADGTGLVAQILKPVNFVGVTWVIKRPDYATHPQRYDAVFQASSQSHERYYAVVQLLQSMNWKSVGIFSDDDEFFNSMESTIKDIVKLPEINVSISYIGPKLPVLNKENIGK